MAKLSKKIVLMALICGMCFISVPTYAAVADGDTIMYAAKREVFAGKATKSKVKITTRLLPNENVLVKIVNKNSQTIALDSKIVYKRNGKTIGEESESFYGIAGNSTVYYSIAYNFTTTMKGDKKPTSVSVKYNLSTNYFKPQLKSIKNLISTKITSKEYNEFGDYQTLHVDVKNKTKHDIYGSITVLYYSKGKLVASEEQSLSINARSTSYEEWSPFIFADGNYKIDSIKIVQGDLRYSN